MQRTSTKAFVIAGIAVSLVLAFLVSPYASSKPDGLEKVASENGIAVGVADHAVADSPLADYAVEGVDNADFSTGLAGIVGVTVTFVVGLGLFSLMRVYRRRKAPPPATVT